MKLALFFTRGISLKQWLSQGLFDREKLIYEEHLIQNNFQKIYWFTYGSNDKELSEQLKRENRLHQDIEIFEMPKLFNMSKIGSYLYSLFLPLVHKNILKQSDILKTNQMDGSWSAIFAKWITGKPLILRTGYTLSQLEYSKNKNSLRFKCYRFIERFAYKYSNKAIVASEHNKNYLLRNNYLDENKIEVIKNFIDIDRFKELNLKRYDDRILFVGRLNKEKNLFNLIEAICNTDLILDIYGQGVLEKELQVFSKKVNAKVNFMGVVPNIELPKIYNSYMYYILPSYFEGMPKTLLEAMACGCVCIGTNVSGINEVIEDGFNGFLSSDINSKDIYETIMKVVNKNNNDISLNAIKNIKDKFTLSSIVEKEKIILEKHGF